MTGAQALLKALQEVGCDYLFGLPGTTVVPILDVLPDFPKCKYILTLQEAVAVAMADGYTKATGRIGVVNLYNSVGTFNALVGIYNAYRDNTPIVVTAGDKDSRLLGREGFCVLQGLTDLVRPVTKWSWTVSDSSQIVRDFYRAVKIATSPPCGPVYLAIPENFLIGEYTQEFPKARGLTSVHSVIVPSKRIIEEVAIVLTSALRPVLVAGSEVATYDAYSEMIELAEICGAPVFHEPGLSTTSNAFPQDHPHYLGFYNYENAFIKEADVIFFVGGKVFLEFNYPYVPEIPDTAKVIHLHPNSDELAKLYPTDYPLLGHIKESLKELLIMIKKVSGYSGRKHKDHYFSYLFQDQRRPYPLEPMNDENCVSSESLVKEMANIFDPNTIIVDEGILSSFSLLSYYRFTKPRTYYHTCGGGLGWGIPVALGISLAKPENKVVAFVGDGSALFTIQALWTAAHYNIPVLIIVCHNKSYKAVYAALRERREKALKNSSYVGCTINNPPVDFVSLAKGFGVEAVSVYTDKEIRKALEHAVGLKKPYLVEVHVS
ncbi:MAG: thiamine pyrophosphate-binding protein [Deltaproteobacteria bacterium]|nr:thiamine pyrophosphate-binding protein [Deltaproteobacteria bacterium]